MDIIGGVWPEGVEEIPMAQLRQSLQEAGHENVIQRLRGLKDSGLLKASVSYVDGSLSHTVKRGV